MKTKLCIFSATIFAIALNITALPITNGVPITPDMAFYLISDSGAATNQFKSDELIFYGLCTDDRPHYYRALPYKQTFDLKLFDEKGREMFSFGKYKNVLVEDVFKKDPSYYSWMMNNDFPLYTKKVLTQIKLRGFNK